MTGKRVAVLSIFDAMLEGYAREGVPMQQFADGNGRHNAWNLVCPDFVPDELVEETK
jgi:hypothetical protein